MPGAIVNFSLFLQLGRGDRGSQIHVQFTLRQARQNMQTDFSLATWCRTQIFSGSSAASPYLYLDPSMYMHLSNPINNLVTSPPQKKKKENNNSL